MKYTNMYCIQQIVGLASPLLHLIKKVGTLIKHK